MNNSVPSVDPVVAPVTKSKRVAYGFKLDFPETFTMRELRNSKGRKVQYITLYMRVKKALASGEIVVVGKQAPKKAHRGRKQLIYRRADAKTPIVTVEASLPVSV